MEETYLPILGALSALENEGITDTLALTMTPVLCEQLADPYMQESFIDYLEMKGRLARSNASEFEKTGDMERLRIAEEYSKRFSRKKAAFEAIDGDIIGAFSFFEDAGLIEIIGSAATHAFLPGLADEHAVRKQISIGVESHQGHFGRAPRGFWVPECAYRNGVESHLESEGIVYILADNGAFPEGVPSTTPVLVGSSGVAALARSEAAHSLVWDERTGFPTGPTYLDTTKYYADSGLLYWSVTGLDVPIGEKAIYDPDAAMRTALDDVQRFIGSVTAELDGQDLSPAPAVVLASFDTELFGHSWREGVYWLELLLRSLDLNTGFRTATPSTVLSNRPLRSTHLLETTWGKNRDRSTWLNPGNDRMWQELHNAHELFLGLRSTPRDGELAARAVAQAARELLLMESSDWPFMVAMDRAGGYAKERFYAHLERFRAIVDALTGGKAGYLESGLPAVEEQDNIFRQLDSDRLLGR